MNIVSSAFCKFLAKEKSASYSGFASSPASPLPLLNNNSERQTSAPRRQVGCTCTRPQAGRLLLLGRGLLGGGLLGRRLLRGGLLGRGLLGDLLDGGGLLGSGLGHDCRSKAEVAQCTGHGPWLHSCDEVSEPA